LKFGQISLNFSTRQNLKFWQARQNKNWPRIESALNVEQNNYNWAKILELVREGIHVLGQFQILAQKALPCPGVLNSYYLALWCSTSFEYRGVWRECLRDPKWSDWSNWSDCQNGQKEKVKRRNCLYGSIGTEGCPDNMHKETQLC